MRLGLLLCVSLVAISVGGCKSLFLAAGASTLEGTAAAYGRDDDPELVAAAIPYSLKTLEGLVVEFPDNVALRLGLASGYTQYTFAFILPDAERLTEIDMDKALVVKKRARKLFLRARSYGLDGLELNREGFRAKLESDEAGALAMLEKDDVPLVYWTAASWGLSIGVANLAPDAVSDFPLVGKLAARALELDPSWNDGTLHELALSLEVARPGGSLDAAKKHFDLAIAASGGRRASSYVTYAEGVCVKEQSLTCFHGALDKALAIDPDKFPNERLANVIAQQRARELKAKAEDLILGGDEEPTQGDSK